MKTVKQIMVEAHMIAKTFEGDYGACLSEAMKISWKNAKENFTPDFIKTRVDSLDKNNVKSIFDSLNGKFQGAYHNMTVEWNAWAEEVLKTVMEKSNGFQSEIAKEAFLGKNLTDKQKWCVAYEYKKVA